MQTFEDYLLTLDPVPAMFRDAMRQGWDAAMKVCTPCTHDGVIVKPGDTVWVIGTCGIYDTQVNPVEPVTNYYLFGYIPVKDAFSTKEAAEKYRYGERY